MRRFKIGRRNGITILADRQIKDTDKIRRNIDKNRQTAYIKGEEDKSIYNFM